MYCVLLAVLRSLAPSPLACFSMGLSSWGPEIGEAIGNGLLVPDLLYSSSSVEGRGQNGQTFLPYIGALDKGEDAVHTK